MHKKRSELAKSLLQKGAVNEGTHQLYLILKDPEPDLKELYEAGLMLHQLGYLDKAIRAFEKVLASDESFTDASIALSVVLNDIGQYDRAREIFEKAEKKVEQNPSAAGTPLNKQFAKKHAELGNMYMGSHRYMEAKLEFEKASQLDPEEGEHKISHARACVKLGRVVKAKEILETCIKEQPKFIPARINLGVILYSEGKVSEAAMEWKKALAIDPHHPDLHHCLGLVSREATI